MSTTVPANPPSRATTLPLPPGPRGYPLVGVLPYLRRDPLRLLTAVQRRYGDVVKLGDQRMFFVTRPEHIQNILHASERRYNKGPLLSKLRAGLGDGLLTSEGDHWRRQRRLMQPAFHRQRLAHFGAIMSGAAEELCADWQPRAAHGEPINVAAAMMGLTLTIVSRALFSHDTSNDAEIIRRSLNIALPITERRFWSFINMPERAPTPDNIRFRRAIAAIDDVVFRIIAARRRSDVDQGDLLAMLLQARDEETGAQMSDQQLRDEVITLLLAGHDTTANLLSWTFYLLSRHPSVESKVYAEVSAVLGGRTPAVADLASLPYTRMVIDEVLRLYPPAWIIGRSPIADEQLGGYRIPANALVLISPYVTHRHPEFWPNPEGFDPERFSPEMQDARPRYAYFPFGGGPRICIGNNFALMEAHLILATVIQRYRLDLIPGYPAPPRPMVTLHAGNGVWMLLHPR